MLGTQTAINHTPESNTATFNMALEEYLTQRRKEIDRKYDYRYSHLTQVFGRLLYETRVSEEELRGFSEDKLKTIRSLAKFLAEDTAA